MPRSVPLVSFFSALQHGRRGLRFAVLSSLTLSFASAQTPGTGAISGVVADSTHQRIQHAEIEAVNLSTGTHRLTRTGEDGLFRLPLLPPGEWTVTVHADGFATRQVPSVTVTTGDTASVTVDLQVAGVATTVQVPGSATVTQVESSTLGGLVNHEAVEALPLSNRNYTQILALSPGVIVDLPNATQLGTGTQNVASNGATPLANNIQFNGVDANNLMQNSAALSGTSQVGTAVPAPDTIEQFQVLTANFDAGYGRGNGANVDLVSRNGGNNVHGSVWEFVRNNIFNANEFFAKQDGQPRAELKHNQFGAAIGGAILRDRTFFFAAYQGTREANGLGDAQHPILPLLTEDRSAAALGAQFCPANHTNAQGSTANGYLTQAGGIQVACDGSNINPVALTILNAKAPTGQFRIPTPQVVLPLTGADASDQLPVGQSTFAPPSYYNEDQFTANLDHLLSGKNTLTGRFFYSRSTLANPFPQNLTNLPGWPSTSLNRNTNFVLADTHVFSATLVNIARFGFIRFDGLSSIQNALSSADVGQDTPIGSPSAAAAPGLQVAGFAIGDAGNPNSWQVTNSFIWQDTLAWTNGHHNARFGLELKRFQVDEDQPEETDGLLEIGTFADFLVGQSAAQNGSPQGVSNISGSFAGGGIYRRDTRYTDLAGFAQDDMKLAPRFTLNAGLRYEIFAAPVETHGRLANFNPFAAQGGPLPATGTFSGQTLPANFVGDVPAGVVRTPFSSFYQTPLADVSPRLGFAWQLTHRPTLVLRGGYGIYYDRHSGTISEQTLSQLPFATLQIGFGSQNAGASLAHPFQPFVLPQSSYPVFQPRTPSTAPFIEATNPNLRDSRTQEYNLNLQYDLGRAYLLEIGYVGTNSAHRSGQWEFDQAQLASTTIPVNGETTNSINNVTDRMPYQGISQGSLLTDDNFVANYNALQASLTRRLSHGLQLKVSYTWSKNLDEVNGEAGTDTFELQLPTNNQLDLRHSSYGLAGDDRDQRFVTNFVWNTPTLHRLPTMLRETAAHWQFSGIAVLQSGIPLSIFDGNAGSVYGLLGGEVRAQLSGAVKLSTTGSLFTRVQTGYLNPAAFTRAPQAPGGTSPADQDFGNSGVGLVRGPGQHNMDLAVERVFPLHFAHLPEASRLSFRTEFFNLTNTPQFANPNTNLGYTDPTLATPAASQTFGRITGTIANPRIIQFAARYSF